MKFLMEEKKLKHNIFKLLCRVKMLHTTQYAYMSHNSEMGFKIQCEPSQCSLSLTFYHYRKFLRDFSDFHLMKYCSVILF